MAGQSTFDNATLKLNINICIGNRILSAINNPAELTTLNQ